MTSAGLFAETDMLNNRGNNMLNPVLIKISMQLGCKLEPIGCMRGENMSDGQILSKAPGLHSLASPRRTLGPA